MIARPLILAFGLGWLALAPQTRAATATQTLDKADLVKAAVIEKIARFIDWPKPPDGQFVLCVAGEHPQLQALRAYYENIAIGERAVAIQVVKKGESASACRVLFLAPRDLPDLKRHRAAADRDNILLIAEGDGAARAGVHVAFYSDSGRLKLEVNRKALETSGLKASFRLLEVAKVVD